MQDSHSGTLSQRKVPPFAGTLFCKEDELAQLIIAGLRKTDYNSESYLNYCMENFSLEKILPKWLDMFMLQQR